MDISTLATEAHGWFETATRPDGEEETYVRTRDGSPDWVKDLVRSAHVDFLPDDWRYEQIQDALAFIAEGAYEDADAAREADFEFADSAVDDYTSGLCVWLSSHSSRPGYCEEAKEELLGGSVTGTILDWIALGQHAEAREIYGVVVEELEEELERREEAAA